MNTAAAAVLLSLMVPVCAAADPRVLGDSELDTVTAAGVLVDVTSFAGGLGDRTRTLTDAKTTAVPGKRFDLGIGLTLGHGFACCGEDADVEVGSAASGVGDIVHRGTRLLKRDDGVSAQGLSAGYVVAVSFNEPLLMIGELRPALADVRSKLGNSGAK